MRTTPRTFIVPTCLFAFTLLCGIVQLGRKSLWDDEGFTAMAAQLPADKLLSLSIYHDQHTGLFHFVLWAWTRIFGTSEFSLRLPSAIFAALAVVVFHALVKRLYDQRLAVVASIALAFNGYFLNYVQEARPYSLAMLLTCIAMLRFVIAIENPSRSRNWVLWGFSAGMCIYGHPFALLASTSALLSLVAIRFWPSWKMDLAKATCAIGLTIVPMIGMLVSNRYDHLSWTQPFGIVPLMGITRSLTGRGNLAMVLTVVIALLAFIGTTSKGLINATKSRETWRDLLVVTWAIVLPLVVVSVSVFNSVLVARYFSPAFPAVVLATVIAVSRVKDSASRSVIALGLVVSSLAAGVHWYTDSPKDDWRSLTAYVMSKHHSGDGVLFTRSNRLPFEYYVLQNDNYKSITPISPTRAWGTDMPNDEPIIDFSSSGAIHQAVNPYERVWVPYLEERGLDPTLAATLRELYGPPQSKVFDGLVLRLYDANTLIQQDRF